MITVVTLLNAATAPITGDIVADVAAIKTLQAFVVGTGAVAATVLIEGSNFNHPDSFVPLGTITLSGTAKAADSFDSNMPWKYLRAKVTAVSGTGAKVFAGVGA